MTDTNRAKRARLILVYNADTGLIQALMHAVHKQFRPDTYPCSLCALTYGAVSMRRDWRTFLDDLDLDVAIYHRDDFTDAYPQLGTGGAREAELPCILLANPGKEPFTAIPAHELDAMSGADELMDQVEKVLAVCKPDPSAASTISA